MQPPVRSGKADSVPPRRWPANQTSVNQRNARKLYVPNILLSLLKSGENGESSHRSRNRMPRRRVLPLVRALKMFRNRDRLDGSGSE
jgi:hypothetical protein